MPVVVRMVLPLAAGAMLAPLPVWSGSGVVRLAESAPRPAESAPVRAVLATAILREDEWAESGMMTSSEAESESPAATTWKVKTHRISLSKSAALASHATEAPPDIVWIVHLSTRGPGRAFSGFPNSSPLRGPPLEDRNEANRPHVSLGMD